MSQEEELRLSDRVGICAFPVRPEEIKPEIHDELGLDHSDGPGPVNPVIDVERLNRLYWGEESDNDELDRRGTVYENTSTPINNTLLNRLRAAGITVVEVPGWDTRGRPYTYGPLMAVLNHHTAGPLTSSTLTPSLSICINGRSDLPGPLCQFYGGRDRKLYVVARGYANHAGEGSLPVAPSSSGNSHLVGIEWENTGTGESWDNLYPTMVTVNAVILDYLWDAGTRRTYNWDHKEYTTRKIDRAGVLSSKFRTDVDGWSYRPPAPPKPPAPPAPPAPKPVPTPVPVPKPVSSFVNSLEDDEMYQRYKSDSDKSKYPGEFVVTVAGGVHLKNVTHRNLLVSAGKVSTDVQVMPEADVVDVFEGQVVSA